MEQNDNTNENEVEIQDVQIEDELIIEDNNDYQDNEPSNQPVRKLSYEEKLAQAATMEEKFAIANAEASKNRRLAYKKTPESKAQNQSSQNNNQSQTSSPSSVDIEETVLKANGMGDELLKELKAISKVRNVSLIEAQKDFLFVAAKEKFEKDEKSKSASLGASRGSSQQKPKKTFETPGLSREEHKAMYYN